MGSSTPDLTGARWRKSSYSGSTGGECVEVAALDGARWRKSSYSGDTGGDCVEAAVLGDARWRKSSHSSSTGGDCIEIADLGGTVAVRDSKVPDGPVLALSPGAFAAFADFVRAAARPGLLLGGPGR